MTTPDKSLTVPESHRLDARQSAAHASRLTVAGTTFDVRLVYDLVIGLDDAATVFRRYGVSEETAAKLLGHPTFQQALKVARDDVTANGTGFRVKARVMAEDLLEEAYVIAKDSEQPANVRADLIKWAAKMGDLEPAPKDKVGGGGGGQGGGFSLSITLVGAGGAADPGRVIDVTPGRQAEFVVLDDGKGGDDA